MGMSQNLCRLVASKVVDTSWIQKNIYRTSAPRANIDITEINVQEDYVYVLDSPPATTNSDPKFGTVTSFPVSYQPPLAAVCGGM